MTPRTAGRRLSKGVVHGMKAIRARADAGQPMKAWDYYRQMNMWDAYKPFVQEAHDDRLELLDLIEADRSLLLDAALRRLVEAQDAIHNPDGTPEDYEEYRAAWDAARAALAATDVRGALVRVLEEVPFPPPTSTDPHGDLTRFVDAILAALAAKGVGG